MERCEKPECASLDHEMQGYSPQTFAFRKVIFISQPICLSGFDTRNTPRALIGWRLRSKIRLVFTPMV